MRRSIVFLSCVCLIGLSSLAGAQTTVAATGAELAAAAGAAAAPAADAAAAPSSDAAPAAPSPDAAAAPAPDGAAAGGGQAAAPAAPAPDAISLAQGKLRFGMVFYGDWAWYHNTGFGPQFITQTNFPGPGNDNFNTFDIQRTYLNVFFIPTDWVTFRLTPNVYRQAGGATADKLGKVGGMGSTVDGNLSVRIKYAYLEFGKIFDKSAAFKGTNFRFGSQTNPLIDWEEGFIDYRFLTLVPWNYLSLSSTHNGASLNGAIKAHGKQYLDFQVGIFNQTNFHQIEQAETKQFMVRGSFYPMGATSRFQGFGVTGFYDHGTSNNAPDVGTATVVRTMTAVHYTTKKNGAGIIAEFDTGKNAFGLGNMFSGSEPQDLLGLGATQYAGMASLSSVVLAGTQTKQRGYYLFGRANVPNTGWGFFAFWHEFQPNTNVADNPLDFARVAGGVAYRFNRNLRFAVSSQNVLYRHSQFTFPVESLATLSPALAAANPNGIANAVPPNIRAIFANFEFTF